MEPTLAERVTALLSASGGLTDREITDAILGRSVGQQRVNQVCRKLETQGVLQRRPRPDRLLGNYLAAPVAAGLTYEPITANPVASMEEDALKATLQRWLSEQGWECTVAWGRRPGIDLVATRGSARWLMEVKGCGSRPQMRVNYFLGMLGEVLQRMDDPTARYSIAMPDLPQFQRLWQRLPPLAKERTLISALFVSADGGVSEAY